MSAASGYRYLVARFIPKRIGAHGAPCEEIKMVSSEVPFGATSKRAAPHVYMNL
jgi:hypothetical protein